MPANMTTFRRRATVDRARGLSWRCNHPPSAIEKYEKILRQALSPINAPAQDADLGPSGHPIEGQQRRDRGTLWRILERGTR